MGRGRSVVFARASGLLLVAASVLAAAPAEAGLPEQHVLAAPGGWLSTYATPLVAVEVGGALTFTNQDIMYHDVVSRETGGNDRAWCHLYQPGQCPLFWSALVPFGESTPILGLDRLAPGTVYEFYCTDHPGMVGRLVALPET